MKITKIYLVSNIEGNANKIYIGKTSYKSRESQHRKTFGKEIEFDFIDQIISNNKNDWKYLESFWIEQFRQWGFEIVNKNAGGGGPEVHSENTKQKMSLSRKGKKQSDEWKLKRSIKLKNVALPKFTCQYCDKVLGGKGNLSKHETSCLHNPNRIKIKYPNMSKAKLGIPKVNKDGYKRPRTQKWKEARKNNKINKQ